MSSEAQRRANKAHAERLSKSGHIRITLWLKPDAGKGAKRLAKRNKVSISEAINQAIIFAAGA